LIRLDLPAPFVAADGDDLAGKDVEIDLAHRHDRAVALADAAEGEEGGWRSSGSSPSFSPGGRRWQRAALTDEGS
jgi:hypothetical protein